MFLLIVFLLAAVFFLFLVAAYKVGYANGVDAERNSTPCFPKDYFQETPSLPNEAHFKEFFRD